MRSTRHARMIGFVGLIGLAGLGVVFTPPIAATAAQAPAAGALNTSVSAVVARAGEFLRDYRQQLSYVMASEKYVQKLHGGISLYDVEETLQSDVFFVYLTAEKVWMAIRDVATVDGVAVPNRENVKLLLNSTSASGVARELKNRNARFNLGTIYRNFNEPTLSLLALDEDHRARYLFKRQGVNTRGSNTLVRISFIERHAPTLILQLNGQPALTEGEFTIDAATGHIERAELRVTLGKVNAKLTTIYAQDPRLQMWLPKEFSEDYTEKGQRVQGLARYSDYQRFDVEVRIK